MFRRARQVIRRALQNFYHKVRRRLKGIEIYSIEIALGASLRSLRFRFSPVLVFYNLAPLKPAVLTAELECRVLGADTSLDVEVRIDESPTESDAEVHDMESDDWIPDVQEAEATISTPVAKAVDPDFVGDMGIREVAMVKFKANLRDLSNPIRSSVKPGDRLVRSLPIVRQGMNIFRLPADERVGYWRELVSQINRQPRELELIGIYPAVPRRGLRRVGMVRGAGNIQMWLDPAAGSAPLATLILAKERSTGKLYRVFDRRRPRAAPKVTNGSEAET